jgi:HlyD family secretion protein
MPIHFSGARSPLSSAAALTLGLLIYAVPGGASAAEPEAAKGTSVTVIKAVKSCFAANVEVFGILVPTEEVAVRPDREGLKVAQIMVDPGGTVTSGQPLARLTAPDGGDVLIQAPVTGIIAGTTAAVGAPASSSGPPLFRIIARSEFDLVGDVSARDMAKLATSQPVAIKVVGAGTVQGVVRRTTTTIDPTTQLGQVHIGITSKQPLLVNASGRATIKTGESCGVSVPLTAVLYGNGGPVVQVVRRQRVETHRVEVGLLSAGQVEIREGVTEGDIVVAKAGALLREGDPVRAISADTAEVK